MTDAWIALNGKIYNITDYLDFHPGGDDVLFELAGTDATAAFMEVHSWVNYEFILKDCFLGVLINQANPQLD